MRPRLALTVDEVLGTCCGRCCCLRAGRADRDPAKKENDGFAAGRNACVIAFGAAATAVLAGRHVDSNNSHAETMVGFARSRRCQSISHYGGTAVHPVVLLTSEKTRSYCSAFEHVLVVWAQK